MKDWFSFSKNPDKRTQVLIVMGFIILPVIAMVWIFMDLIKDERGNSSQRMQIPPQILEIQRQQNLQQQ